MLKTRKSYKNQSPFTKNIVIILFLQIFISSIFHNCQSPYFNDKLDAGEQIPVFNAILTNIDVINSFELYYAMPYTDKRKIKIPGAVISIESNTGDKYYLEEIDGNYILSDASFLQFNKSYTATIILPDGTILQSSPMVFQDTIGIENIYYDYNNKISIVENASGDFIEVQEQGIFINVRLKQPVNETVYYRASANYYVHSQRFNRTTEAYNYDNNGYTYNYEIRFDTMYDVIQGFSNTALPEIGELLPGINYPVNDLTVETIFLPADQECKNFSMYTQNDFVQWIFPIDVYTNSYEVYKYYTDAINQLTAPNRIYDPIPEQLVGNIKNITDPEQVTLGLFDVSSVSRRYYAVYVSEAYGYRSYQGRFYNDTVFKQGEYPFWFQVDTVFIDSIPINN